MTEIKIERSLPVGLERVAATLYWEAFGRKLGWALGPSERAIEFLSAASTTMVRPTRGGAP